MIFVQAGAVHYNGCGILIMGAPNTGKSWLAWQLLQQGGYLVADDGLRLHNGIAFVAQPRLMGWIARRSHGFSKARSLMATRITHVVVRGVYTMPLRGDWAGAWPSDWPVLHVPAAPLCALQDVRVFVGVG